MRDEFLLPDDLIYLNTGTMSYSPRCVQDAIAAYARDIDSNPAQGFINAWPKLWKAQQELASFIKARPVDIFLRTNVTYAMCDFLMALPLPRGSEILLSNLEYGGVANVCRYKAELDGLELKIMKVPFGPSGFGDLSESELLDLFQKSLTKKTGLVMFSHVATGSGFRFPMEKIAKICRARDVVFAVDGAHGIGSEELDFSKSSVDFYGSNLHKWMVGPKGTGFGWVAPHMRERLVPRFAGWTTYGVHPLFSQFGGGDQWTYRWMLCSTHNFSDFIAISDTVGFWKKLGMAAITTKQNKLRNFAADTVTRRTGWPCVSQMEPGFHGPMVAFALPDALSHRGVELMSFLKEKHSLQIAMTQIQERWLLRLAPHIYNTETEIERAAEILSRL